MFTKGTHRYVFIVGSLVFKIPRIRILNWFWKVLSYDVWEEKLLNPLYLSWRVFARFVFGGIMENYREALCFICTRHRLLAKIYLPLIVINVCKREREAGKFTFNPIQLSRIVRATDDKQLIIAFSYCGHTFDDPNNLAGNDEHVKILDYGETNVHKLIQDHGDRLEQLLRAVYNPSVQST